MLKNLSKIFCLKTPSGCWREIDKGNRKRERGEEKGCRY